MSLPVFSCLGLLAFLGSNYSKARSITEYARAENVPAYYHKTSEYLYKHINCPLASTIPQWTPSVREPRLRIVFLLYLEADGHIERAEVKESAFEYVATMGKRLAVQSSSGSFWLSYQECMRQQLLQLPCVEPMHAGGKTLKTIVVLPVIQTLWRVQGAKFLLNSYVDGPVRCPAPYFIDVDVHCFSDRLDVDVNRSVGVHRHQAVRSRSG